MILLPEILGRLLYVMISTGVKAEGTFDPNEVMPHFEENLTEPEWLQVKMFLTWVHENNIAFGSGNCEEVYAQFYKVEMAKQEASDQYWKTNT